MFTDTPSVLSESRSMLSLDDVADEGELGLADPALTWHSLTPLGRERFTHQRAILRAIAERAVAAE